MLPGGDTLLALLVFLAGSIAAPEKRQEPRQPIMLDRSGGFVVGGKTIESPTFPGSMKLPSLSFLCSFNV